MKKKSRVPKGPICWDCGVNIGGIAPTYPVTCSEDKCAQCGEKKLCPSVSDFDWPKAGVKRVFD